MLCELCVIMVLYMWVLRCFPLILCDYAAIRVGLKRIYVAYMCDSGSSLYGLKRSEVNYDHMNALVISSEYLF